jgi:DNA-directed RNA polymerase specialized sigma24 family protein
MIFTINSSDPAWDAKSSSTWQALYPSVRALISRQVYSSRLSSWRGQEEEIVEDILQETARRIIEYAYKAETGKRMPICRLESLVIVTACNCCKDMKRRERRFKRLGADASIVSGEHIISSPDQAHWSEEVVELVYQEELFTLLAHEIAAFPNKQRSTLLIDLANRMSFGERPTPLQKAFLEVGIHLEDYQQPLPDDLKERRNYAALLYHAYRRVAQLASIREYGSVA